MERTARPQHASRRGDVRETAPADVEALAWLLDNSIPVPGTSWRIGLDAVIGLIPGFGDLVAGGLGLMLVARAAQLRLPGVVIARMLANVGLDLITGLVPVLGDAVDAWYKSNQRNVNLIRRYSAQPDAPTTGSWLFFGGLLLALVLIVAGIVWLVTALIAAIVG
jgi:hypothetical protein